MHALVGLVDLILMSFSLSFFRRSFFMLAGRPHRNAQPPDRFGDLVFFSDRAGVLDVIPSRDGVSDGRRNRVGE